MLRIIVIMVYIIIEYVYVTTDHFSNFPLLVLVNEEIQPNMKIGKLKEYYFPLWISSFTR